MTSKTNEECAICLTELASCELLGVVAKCAHTFCFECIQHWSSIEPTCPVDREKIEQVHVLDKGRFVGEYCVTTVIQGSVQGPPSTESNDANPGSNDSGNACAASTATDISSRENNSGQDGGAVGRGVRGVARGAVRVGRVSRRPRVSPRVTRSRLRRTLAAATASANDDTNSNDNN